MLLLSLLLSLSPPPSAHATLGEGEASIENVRRAFGATRQAVVGRTARRNSAVNFKMHELRARPIGGRAGRASGITLREYVNADGKVFAVSWQGFRTPNLQEILGGYAPEAARLESTPSTVKERAARSRYMESKSLIEARNGHPRGLRGRYLSVSLAPKGVTLDDIQ
ncbi:MAG: DUF2844 domain-containing protein [Bdellovibrionales bacterium]|nr:DUF2844 domain-containing protein [Bdellovibrionales bacterium]